MSGYHPSVVSQTKNHQGILLSEFVRVLSDYIRQIKVHTPYKTHSILSDRARLKDRPLQEQTTEDGAGNKVCQIFMGRL
jgi:hypothetical protein